MEFLKAKYLVLLMLSCSIVSALYAQEYNEQEFCLYTALNCGVLDIQVQAGVNPIRWRQKDSFNIVNCDMFALLGINPVLPLFSTPSFNTFFKTPWMVGAQVGYACSDAIRVYGEFNYVQAHSKNSIALSTTNPLIAPIQTFTFTLSNYKLYDFYVGTRYYTRRWCNKIAFFIGGKLGIVHHKAVNFSATVSTAALAPIIIPAIPVTSLFLRNTSVSGGADFGVDICLNGNLSLVLTGQVIANCGPKANSNIPIAANMIITSTNFVLSPIGTELQFPLTAGIRYNF